MSLGEAFVEIKADLRPFRRDLDVEIKRITDDFETKISAAVSKGLSEGAKRGSEKSGEDSGDRFTRGFKKKVGEGASIWVKIAAAMGSALDDGLSALPAEIKALIVAGILAAVPFISAALTGAITAGVGAGFAILGIALATQFEQVQTRGMQLFGFLRIRMIEAAEPFGRVVLGAIDLIEQSFEQRIAPLFDKIFVNSAKFVGPLTEGLVNGIELFLESIEHVTDKAGPFVDALGNGFTLIAAALGQALEILVDTGDEGVEGLRDLLFVTADLIVGLAKILAFFTELYGAVRDFAQAINESHISVKLFTYAFLPFLPFIVEFVGASDDAATISKKWSRNNLELEGTFYPLISATQKQIQASDKLADAFEKVRKAEFDTIEANILYEESLDKLSRALEENGDTLAFETEEGRGNLRAFSLAFEKLQETIEGRYKTGQLNAQQAQALYDQEIAKIKAMGEAWGLTADQIDEVFGRAIKLFELPDPNAGWLEKILTAAKLAAIQLERAVKAARELRQSTGSSGDTPYGGGLQEFAEGGILHKPTLGIYGEAGPEAVIPMTKPARAVQLMRQSGLDRLLGAAQSIVNVFIGNEQLDSRTVRIVQENTMQQGRALAYGAR